MQQETYENIGEALFIWCSSFAWIFTSLQAYTNPIDALSRARKKSPVTANRSLLSPLHSALDRSYNLLSGSPLSGSSCLHVYIYEPRNTNSSTYMRARSHGRYLFSCSGKIFFIPLGFVLKKITSYTVLKSVEQQCCIVFGFRWYNVEYCLFKL